MRAAAIGVVKRIGIAALIPRPSRAAPRASMIVRMLSPIDPRWTGCAGIGDQRPPGVEQGAGEIEPLLDVDRHRGRLQRDPHLLGDRHEEVVEDFQPHRVDRGADGVPPRDRHRARQHQCRIRRTHRLPARLDHRRRGRFEDQRRSVDRLPGAEVVTTIGRPFARFDRACPLSPGHLGHARPRGAGDRFDAQRVDYRLAGSTNPKRRRWSASNAARIDSGAARSTSIVVSLPGARSRARQ